MLTCAPEDSRTNPKDETIKKDVCNIVDNFLAKQKGKIDKGFCVDDDTKN